MVGEIILSVSLRFIVFLSIYIIPVSWFTPTKKPRAWIICYKTLPAQSSWGTYKFSTFCQGSLVTSILMERGRENTLSTYRPLQQLKSQARITCYGWWRQKNSMCPSAFSMIPLLPSVPTFLRTLSTQHCPMRPSTIIMQLRPAWIRC